MCSAGVCAVHARVNATQLLSSALQGMSGQVSRIALLGQGQRFLFLLCLLNIV